MMYLLYSSETGNIIQHRSAMGIETAQDMMVHVFGDNIPQECGCIETGFADLPIDKKVDLQSLTVVDA